MNSKLKFSNFVTVLLVLILSVLCITCFGIEKSYAQTKRDTQKLSTPIGFNTIAASDLTIAPGQFTEKDYEMTTIDTATKDEHTYIDVMEHRTDRFIVKYKDSMGSDSLHKHLQNRIKDYYWLDSLKEELQLILLNEKVSPDDFIRSLIENTYEDEFNYQNSIEYIHEDYQFISASLNAIDENTWEEMLEHSIDESLDYSEPVETVADGIRESGDNIKEDVIIAVLDTGVDITHQDLKNNIWINVNELLGNNIDDDVNGYVDDINGWNFVDKDNCIHNENEIYDESHGTHIAGIIASNAPESKIMPLKVIKNGVAYTSDIIMAINYAERMGAKIVNCSWESTDYNPALKDVIDNSDMLFVCAAGNRHINMDETPVYPAAFDSKNILSVAAVDQDGNLSSFSNYGESSVDILAWGEEIWSTQPENKYALSSGTSFAAAFISAEASKLLKTSEDTVYELREQIIRSSEQLLKVDEIALNNTLAISGSEQLTYIYDQNNRLIEIRKSSRVVATLQYDKNGNLIRMQVTQ